MPPRSSIRLRASGLKPGEGRPRREAGVAREDARRGLEFPESIRSSTHDLNPAGIDHASVSVLQTTSPLRALFWPGRNGFRDARGRRKTEHPASSSAWLPHRSEAPRRWCPHKGPPASAFVAFADDQFSQPRTPFGQTVLQTWERSLVFREPKESLALQVFQPGLKWLGGRDSAQLRNRLSSIRNENGFSCSHLLEVMGKMIAHLSNSFLHGPPPVLVTM